MSRPDLIRWVIDWMMANENAITEELALRCEREARAEWGGQRVDYIPKVCEADRQKRRALQGRTDPEIERRVVADYLANEPVQKVASRHGVSRRTLYRMLKR